MITFGKHLGRILYMGDSITWGYAALTGGWRKPLNNSLEADHVIFNCVGNMTNDSPSMSKPNHIGVSGDRATYMNSSVIGSRISTYQPEVVILGFGMNDIGNGVTPTNFINAYKVIIDAINANKYCRIFIQKIIIPSQSHSYTAYLSNYTTANNLIADLVNYSSNVKIIEIENITTSDGIHPSDGANGYGRMAEQIKETLL